MTDLDVLIVDDDDATRNGLRELLAYAGVSADDARDGTDALKKIDKGNFRVVLLDVQLPGVSGLDVLSRCGAKRSIGFRASSNTWRWICLRNCASQ